MTAIVTNTFKQFMLDKIKADFEDSATNAYYMCIGRSEDWNAQDAAPSYDINDALSSIRNSRNTRLALQSAKAITNLSYVIPRYDWVANTTYPSYDDSIANVPTNGYYVLTDENNVYICLQQGKDGGGAAVRSTIKPTGTTTNPLTTADGYVWKFMYNISTGDANKYVSTNFIPVSFVDSAVSYVQATEQQQKGIQDNALAIHPKSIVGYEIINNGAGTYPASTTQTVTIVGNGSGAQATATIDANGNIIKVTVDDSSDGDKNFGKNYDYAKATVGGGGSGSIRPIFSPLKGIGGDPTVDLRANSIMFNVKMEGNETNTILASNDFRQVSLIRNPKTPAGAAFSTTTGLFLKKLVYSNLSGGTFSEDDIVTGATSGAKGFVDYKGETNKLWYHQNDSTGYTPFQGSETISNGSGVTAILLGSNFDSAADIDKFSGDLLYTDNRAAIDRNAAQTEDLKIVIRF